MKTVDIDFKNIFITLGKKNYTLTKPTPVESPSKIIFNHKLSNDLGINPELMNSDLATQIFAGNHVPESAEPLAAVYAGHQFGNFNPTLGDGRAILLGETLDNSNNLVGIQLKGSGVTPYSRSGDGRSTLGSVLREYLLSEAMHNLGIPTTRALAAISSGEKVIRNNFIPGGVLTRVSKSFIRIGSFQYFAKSHDVDSIRKLADYVIKYNYPNILEYELSDDQKYLTLLTEIIKNQAKLIAKWMSVGFIHGVMNTDNTSIVGETIDYGPCAFMDAYNHYQVFSSIDINSRYSYDNQASMAKWNLTRLAECMIPLFNADIELSIKLAKTALAEFEIIYQTSWLAEMRLKFGLQTSHNDDNMLFEEFFNILHDNSTDMTLSFYELSKLNLNTETNDSDLTSMFTDKNTIDLWLQKWRLRLKNESSQDKERQKLMQSVNPVYIPRNHIINRAIIEAEDNNDFSLFHHLHAALEKPFTHNSKFIKCKQPPSAQEIVTKTYCGT